MSTTHKKIDAVQVALIVARYAGAIAALFWLAGTASAAGSVPGAMTVIGTAPAPIGYAQFCADTPGECAGTKTDPRRVVLTSQVWRQLNTFNREINTTITPMTDMELHGVVERWSYPVNNTGDCEDYVLEKRSQLINAGWPVQTLLITVVRDEKGDGHAVLTVVTDQGDLVLDNQRDDIRLWSATGYDFIKRQSQHEEGRWVYVGPGEAVGVASTR